MKKIIVILIAVFFLIAGQAYSQTTSSEGNMKSLETEHYTFKLSDKVTKQKVSFKNRYGTINNQGTGSM